MTLIATYALPANARPTHSTYAQSPIVAAAAQVLPVSTGPGDAVVRDGYTVTAAPPPPPPAPPPTAEGYEAAPASGAAVQWPFPMPVRISSGFGYRDSPCSGCSSDHQGLDLNPGAGTPIHAIAGGVVSAIGNPASGWGVYVKIDHEIDGQRVSSLYAHMEYGSLTLSVGDTVTGGQVVGLVGSTGASTAPHLHLEIHINGTAIDPYAWMTEHAG
ncbi:MAG: M23 family metallopeptidase [Microbacteriaceae bacterium]